MSLFTPPNRPTHLLRTLILANNLTVLAIVVFAAVAVFFTKGFIFNKKVKRVLNPTHDTAPSSSTAPSDSTVENKESIDQDISLGELFTPKTDEQYNIRLYNRIHDPSQFVFESFGFTTPLTIILYLYRVFLSLWMIATIAIDQTIGGQSTTGTYLSFLTHLTACLFTVYYLCHACFGLFYLIAIRPLIFNRNSKVAKEGSRLRMVTLFRVVSNGMWIMGELSNMSNIIVALGYWCLSSWVDTSEPIQYQ